MQSYHRRYARRAGPFQPFGFVRTPDDLDGPISLPGQCLTQLVPGIAGIGEHVPQPRIELAHRGQHANRAIAVLDARRVDDQAV